MELSALVSVIAAGISCGALGPAIAQARSMGKQTKLQKAAIEDAQRPYVWIDFRPSPANGSSVHLLLVNEGPTVARNIRVTCQPSIRRSALASTRESTDEIGIFRNGIASLPPGRQMRWYLGEGADLLRESKLGVHKVTINFEGPFGTEKPIEYELNWLEFADVSGNKTGSLAKIETSLNMLNATVKTLGSGHND